MALNVGGRLKHAWNSFFTEEAVEKSAVYQVGPSYSTRPDRPAVRLSAERTIISSIYTRISVDVAAVRIEHCRVNDEQQYVETIHSGLNNCLTVEANIDQGGRHFRQDIPLTLLAKGTCAILPVDITIDPRTSGAWDIKTMRVGEILEWAPQDVKIRAYNEKKGRQEDIWVPKTRVAIVENPFYATMNEPNSTLQRLIRKLALLDTVDEVSSSGKLDIIIQLPYVVKSETRKTQAENRRRELQEQLQGSTYGIAYTDGTEKITQLNRSVENNLLTQVEYLTKQLYAELGLTPEIMTGTADDAAMLNYMNRTIEPIMDAITEAMARTFLTKTARTQGQTIMYFQSPFKMLPISQLAKVVDALSRNQIVTPNEIRPALGLKPSKSAQADQLVNSNMPLDQQVTDDDAPRELEAAPEPETDDAEARLDKKMQELGL